MSRRKKKSENLFYILDKFEFSDLQKWNRTAKNVQDYHVLFYSSLADQRSSVYGELKACLERIAKPFQKIAWQRLVTAKYMLDPLSISGSINHAVGGRFNIGNLDESRFERFPALYLAVDKHTAFAEKFGIEDNEKNRGLKASDIIFNKDDSIAYFSVNFSLDTVLDLTQPDDLRGFVDLIKGFSIPKEIKSLAKSIKIPEPGIVKSVDRLLDGLLEKNWRSMPTQFDIPSNSQIFGKIARDAGIQGILYPSQKTKKSNMAIFVENIGDESYVELDPRFELPKEVKNRKIQQLANPIEDSLEMSTPNAETRKAIKDGRKRKNLTSFDTADDLMNDLKSQTNSNKECE